MSRFRKPRYTFLVALLVTLAAGCGSAAPAGDRVSSVLVASVDEGSALQQRFVSIVKSVSPAVVQVRTSVALGSGVVFDARGDVVTNAHVVGDATRYVRSRMNARSRERLLDALVEAYVGWRETCDWVNDAYRRWTLETGAAAAVTFALYMGALDAEQQAAEAYARLVLRVGKLSWAEEPTAEPLGEPESGVDWP